MIVEATAFVGDSGLVVGGIGWTGQMHGLVAVDSDLRALTPFVTWRDKRCAPPKLGSGILDDWSRKNVKGIHLALPITSYIIARRTGRCLMDVTFRASLGTDAQLRHYEAWLPEIDESSMIGDNQAGVYAAQRIRPGALVMNLGTSGQLSRVVDGSTSSSDPSISVRPFPDGRKLLCRASHVGGAALARIREELGISWERLNDEAATNPLISRCVTEIIDDVSNGFDVTGVKAIVGIGNAFRLNACIRRAVEKRFGVECIVPCVDEMAAWGAALYALDHGAMK